MEEKRTKIISLLGKDNRRYQKCAALLSKPSFHCKTPNYFQSVNWCRFSLLVCHEFKAQQYAKLIFHKLKLSCKELDFFIIDSLKTLILLKHFFNIFSLFCITFFKFCFERQCHQKDRVFEFFLLLFFLATLL